MALRITVVTRNASVNGMTALANSGDIVGYNNAQVGAVGGSEAGNTVLFTCTWPATAFAGSSGGTANLNTVVNSDTDADATGTVAHLTFLKSDHSTVIGDCDAAQGSGSASFDNTGIVIHGTVAIASFAWSQPAS